MVRTFKGKDSNAHLILISSRYKFQVNFFDKPSALQTANVNGVVRAFLPCKNN